MGILNRYVVKELITPTLLGFGLFTFVLLLQFLLDLAELFIQQGAGLGEVLWIFVYSLPHVIVMTVPMAVLLGGLIAFGRMSADHEIIAIRAGGISIYRLAVPILLVALVAAGLNLYLFLDVLPWGNTQLRQLQWEMITSRTISGEVKPRVFYEDYPGFILYSEDISPQGDEWRKVLLATKEDPPLLLLADRAVPQFDRQTGTTWLHLENGIVYPPEEERARAGAIRFASRTVRLYEDDSRAAGTIHKDERSMELGELLAEIEQHRQSGEATAYLWVEVHKKFAFSLACIVLGLLALPLGVSTQRHTKATGFVIAVLVIMVYYQFVENGEKYAEQGVVSPWLGMWSANLVLAPLGLILLWKKAREIDLGLADRAGRVWEWVSDRAVELWQRWRRARGRRGDGGHVAPDGAQVEFRRWNFPRILDRYVVTEFLKVYVLAHAAFIAIWVVAEFSERADDFREVEGGWELLIDYFKFYLPQIVHMTLPVAVLIAVLTVFSLMSRHSEVVAALSGGVSLHRLALPILVPALALGIGDFLLQDYVLAFTNRRVAEIKNAVELGSAQSYHAPQRWVHGDGPTVYHFASYDQRRQVFQGLYVFHLSGDRTRLERMVYANRVVWIPEDEAWHAREGWRRFYVATAELGGADPDDEAILATQPESFSFLQLEMPEAPSYFGREHHAADELPVWELREYIADLEARGFDASRYRVDLQQKLAFPAVIVVMTVVGMAFAFRMGRQGTFVGIGIALALAAAFWLAFSAFRAIGYAELLPPLLAAWAPHLIFSSLAAWLLLEQRS